MKIYQTRQGFTLIEVLIVVLIIAILSAVAVPQYQKAVMKSRYSTLMPIAKSLANGNEAYYMDQGQYATSPTELDVAGQDEKYPDGTKVDMSAGEYSYVLAKRDNLPLNYLVYQKHSEKFADNIHCEADENNPMAQEVCQGLGGELINGSQTEGYLTYVLSGMVGANDKLPSSLTKLAANSCAGKPNCTATISGNQVTTQECSGDLNNGKTCTTRTYDDTGTQINYERTQTSCSSFSGHYSQVSCSTSVYSDEQGVASRIEQDACQTYLATWDWDTGACTPLSSSGGTPYSRHIVNEDGHNLHTDYYCQASSDGKCTLFLKDFKDKLGDYYGPLLRQRSATCASSEPNDDFTCNNGDWRGWHDAIGNEHGVMISNVVMRPLNGAGATDFYNTGNNGFADISSSYWNVLSEDGLAIVSQTTPSYSGSNVTFTTKNKQTAEVTNTVTCAITNADWETGTCKPGTAI